MRHTAILAVDPGLRTGLAIWEEGQRFQAVITDPEATCDVIEQWANRHADSPALIVSESFDFRDNTAKLDTGAMHWPLELCGVARYLAYRNEIDFDTQSPGQMKSFVYSDKANPNEKLKRFGLYTPGPEAHARDAAGHLLLAMLTRGLKP